MEFESGFLGVAIVVLGLIGSCLFGVVMNVDQTEVEVDVDDYVTDVTGLYATNSKQEAYMDYNPASNLNGYTSNVTSQYAVDFTKSNTGNNYPFTYMVGSPVTLAYDLSTCPLNNIPVTNPTYPTDKVGIYDYTLQGTPMFSNGEYWSVSLSHYNHNEGIRIINLKEFIENLNGYTETTSKVTFTFKNMIKPPDGDLHDGNYYGYTINMTPGPTTWTETRGYEIFHQDTYYMSIYSPYPNTMQYYADTYGINTEFTMVTAEYTPSDDLIQMYDDTGERIYYGPISGILLTCNASRTATFQVDIYPELHIDYLDARQGITARPGETVTWSNGYKNGTMHILAYLGALDRDKNETYEIGGLEVNKEIGWRFNYGEGVDSILKLEHTANGTTVIKTMYFDASSSNTSDWGYVTDKTVDLGAGWVAFDISLDFINGTVSVQPIPPSSWDGFTNWNSDQPYTYVGEFRVKQTTWTITRGAIVGFSIISPSALLNTVAMQVSDTEVFLNTYGVVLVDPHVNIVNWYPNNEHFKMKFTKISIIGKSVQINGVSYEVDGDEITIDDHVIDLSEFEIEFEKNQNDTYTMIVRSLITDEYATIPDATDTNVAFEGAWYFNAGYYTVSTGTEKSFFWDIGGGIADGYGYTGVILFAMGFIALITFIWWKIQPEMFKFMDILILIGAEIILFIILV